MVQGTITYEIHVRRITKKYTELDRNVLNVCMQAEPSEQSPVQDWDQNQKLVEKINGGFFEKHTAHYIVVLPRPYKHS